MDNIYILDTEKLWHYIVLVFILGGGSIWWILDFLYIHKTQYSIHKILNLPDNIYRFLCIVFLCISIFFLIYFYSIFLKIRISDDNISLHYLKPRLSIGFSKSLLKSYEIKLTKANYRELFIHLKNGKIYRSTGIAPKNYHGLNQLNQLTDQLDKIIKSQKRISNENKGQVLTLDKNYFIK